MFVDKKTWYSGMSEEKQVICGFKKIDSNSIHSFKTGLFGWVMFMDKKGNLTFERFPWVRLVSRK
jgi:hypothetical protein